MAWKLLLVYNCFGGISEFVIALVWYESNDNKLRVGWSQVSLSVATNVIWEVKTPLPSPRNINDYLPHVYGRYAVQEGNIITELVEDNMPYLVTLCSWDKLGIHIANFIIIPEKVHGVPVKAVSVYPAAFSNFVLFNTTVLEASHMLIGLWVRWKFRSRKAHCFTVTAVNFIKNVVF